MVTAPGIVLCLFAGVIVGSTANNFKNACFNLIALLLTQIGMALR